MNTALTDLIGALSAKGRISAEDVLALRAQIYGAGGGLDAGEMEALAKLDAAAGERAPEWVDLVAEAMTDFVVRQQDPADFVDEATGAWLVRALTDVHADAALEALARVLDAATEAPASLERFAFMRAKSAIAERGTVEAKDVALLRRLVFAGGGAGNIGVSREEADALFDINDACEAGANDPAWADFFAKAVADHLTGASPYRPQSREQAMQDEAWLADRGSLGGFVHGLEREPDVGGFVRDIPDILRPYRSEAREWAGAEAAIEAAAAAAATIDDEEARWLIGRLGDGALSSAERALIDFLRKTAPQPGGLLGPLLGAGGSDEPAPVFGRRRIAPGAG